MSAALDYARESILTAPDDLELHALLPWARGEEPLPVSEYRVIDRIVREWWGQQTDAQVMLKELTPVDHRAGVRGAVACARWALEGYWTDGDRRPRIAIETAERWLRGEATDEECKRAADAASVAEVFARATSSGSAAAAANRAAFAAARAFTAALSAASAAAWAASAAAPLTSLDWDINRVAALRELCNVVRAAVQCPPAEVWLREEVRS